ncbi:MAG: DUF1476 domain-containing protein [Pseudomonadota bacterium]|nr:DUF1476 domain-containing protein [Pseudomonadota bacterium]
MGMFDDREKSFEKAFARDAELRFRVHSRCARMLSWWAAGRMNLPPADIEAWVRDVMARDMQKEGIEDLWAILQKDMADRNVPVTLDEIREKSEEFMKKALAELAGQG